MTSDQQDLITALRDLVEHPPGPLGEGLVWVGGQPGPQGAVVLYREHAGGRVLGYRLDVVAHGALFTPDPTMAELAQIVYVDDLCSPAGRGVHRSVAEVEGLVEDPAAIEWVYGS